MDSPPRVLMPRNAQAAPKHHDTRSSTDSAGLRARDNEQPRKSTRPTRQPEHKDKTPGRASRDESRKKLRTWSLVEHDLGASAARQHSPRQRADPSASTLPNETDKPRHVREPQHVPNHPPSSSQHFEHRQHTGAGESDRNFVCTNNAFDPRLKNGARLGRPSECHRRGVGAGLHVKLSLGEEPEFVEKWTGQYEKVIDQSYLYYGDKEAPAGKYHATLPQCVARGFAIGAKKRAGILTQRHATHKS